MRIGIDTTVLEYNKEGIGNYVSQLVKSLREKNKKDLEIIELNPPQYTGLFSGIINALRITKAAKKNKIDILISTHSHLLSLMFYPTFWLIHDIGPIVHPEYFSKNKISPKKWVFNFLFKAAIKSSEQILTTSEFNKQEIINKYKINQNKIRVIGASYGNWINEKINDLFTKKVLEKYNLSANKYIFNLGTLSPRKNIETLLTAYVELIKNPKFKEIKLVIGGKKGWLYEPIFNLFEQLQQENPTLDLNNKITFTDFIDDKTAKVLAENCSVFIYPSLYEGFGMPPLEVLLLGNEVIVSDIPIFKELYKNYAHFFPATDAGRLTAALEKMISGNKINNNKKINELKQKFSWNSVADNLLNVIFTYAKSTKTRR